MDTLIRFNAQTSGRDKLIRLAQFSSGLLWTQLDGSDDRIEIVNTLKNVEKTLQMARQVLSLGRGPECFHSALQSIHYPDQLLRVTITVARIATAMQLLINDFLWLDGVGLMKINKHKWSRISNKFRLYAIIMNLLRDLYEISIILKSDRTGRKYYQGIRPSSGMDPCMSKLLHDSRNWLIANKRVVIDTFKNVCELWLPIYSLGDVAWLRARPGIIGLLGTLSSLAAIIQVIDISCRLSPG